MAKTMADLRPVERLQLGTAAHEAAHSVVAVLSGARLDQSEVVRGGPRTNPAGFRGVSRYYHGATSPLFARDITASGPIGEAIAHHGRAPSSHQLSAMLALNGHDRDELAALARPRRERPEDALTAALPLVLRCWAPIARLATQLHLDGLIDHAAVLAALGVPSDHELPQYAAMIRSGATPGSFSVGAPVRF